MGWKYGISNVRQQFQSDIIQGGEDVTNVRAETRWRILYCRVRDCLVDANNNATRFSEGMRNRVGESRTQLSRRPPLLLIIARINSDSPRSIYRQYVELDLLRYPQAAYGCASLAYFAGIVLGYNKISVILLQAIVISFSVKLEFDTVI